MTTRFTTANPWEPVQVELWGHTGQRLAPISDYERVTFTFADRAADTAELLIPLNEDTAALVPCDGTVLVGMRYGGHSHVTTPVAVQVVSGDTPALAMLKVTCAGGWTLLDGQRVPPSLEAPLMEQVTEEFSITGPVESVVKRLIRVGVQRTGHPIAVLADQRRGPVVTATGAWETVGETVKDLLATTGHRLALDGWLPGDAQPDGFTLNAPTVVADVLPYRSRDGLVWSVDSGDITEWSVKSTRATVTRGAVGYDTDKQETRRYLDVSGRDTLSPWAVRYGYTEYKDHEEIDDRDPDPWAVLYGMQGAGQDMLAKGAGAQDISVSVDVSGLWQFSKRSYSPRTFDIGDVAEVVLPTLGGFKQIVTEVAIEATPTTFTVTPTLGTPDSMGTDIYSTLSALVHRVDRLERG